MSDALKIALVAACVACGPSVPSDTEVDEDPAISRHAEAYCEAARSCGCMDYFFETEAGCRSEVRGALDQIAQRPNVRLDLECLDRFTDAYREAPCAQPELDCSVTVTGSKAGGECELLDPGPLSVVLESCDDGLSCWEGECVDAADSTPRSEGDSCWTGTVLSCFDTSLYCSTEGVCTRRNALGDACRFGTCEPCLGEEDCFGPDVCRQSPDGRRCSEPPVIGEPCDPVDDVVCVDPEQVELAHCSYAEGVCVVGDGAGVCRAFEFWARRPLG